MPKLTPSKSQKEKKMDLFGALSIGIGGMVGGGIFAVLGLAITYAKGGVGLSFLIAGIAALFTGYSYVKLDGIFRHQGGTVTFLIKSFKNHYFTSSLNILLLLSYVVMASLYAYAFGSYLVAFFPSAPAKLMLHLGITSCIIISTLLNFLSSKAVGHSETFLVSIKVAILIFFIVAASFKMDVSRIAVSTWPSLLTIAEAGILMFLAYEGFELIVNSSCSIQNPEKNIPRAIYISISFVILIYILISLVTTASLPFATILSSSNYVLAEAARPSLGLLGFKAIAIAALLSTLSAEMAVIYGTSKIFLSLAEFKQIPPIFSKSLNQELSIWGAISLSITTLLVANLVNLESIATMGSCGFLLIFAAINYANYLKEKEAQSSKWIALVGTYFSLFCFVILIYHASITHPHHIISLVSIITLSVLLGSVYQKIKPKENPSI